MVSPLTFSSIIHLQLSLSQRAACLFLTTTKNYSWCIKRYYGSNTNNPLILTIFLTFYYMQIFSLIKNLQTLL